jgi:hypothetical protein
LFPRLTTTVLFLFLVPVAWGQTSDDDVPNYRPITNQERAKWFVVSTAGPVTLAAAGPLSAAWGTAFNLPKEYGPHWDGFGKRYGMRLTGVSTGNAIEAGLGAAWGEDPRYFRVPDRPFGARVKFVITSTFTAPGPDGQWRPAYARYVATVGNNFLSNTWRERSESGVGDAAIRCLTGFAARMAGNAFAEFWPDVKSKVFRRRQNRHQ